MICKAGLSTRIQVTNSFALGVQLGFNKKKTFKMMTRETKPTHYFKLSKLCLIHKCTNGTVTVVICSLHYDILLVCKCQDKFQRFRLVLYLDCHTPFWQSAAYVVCNCIVENFHRVGFLLIYCYRQYSNDSSSRKYAFPSSQLY